VTTEGRASAGAVVRKATRDDMPAMVESLARAFYDDPVFAWLFPDDARRLGQSRRYFAGRARILMRQDEVYTVDGGAGAAMWARPGGWRDPPLDVIRQLLALVPALGRRLPRSLGGLHEIEERHPSQPHWYLAVLGTDPNRQGEGIGSALLEPILHECDRLEVPAYLETGKERNVAFYSRHGFKVTEEIGLPAGPPMWLMWREAA
jgi:GNAT superfamily N-acetyltransferase